MSDRYVSLNGSIVPLEDASIDVMDRGFRYGDGVFETLRVYGGTVFEWEAHAERLTGGCDALSIDHGLSAESLLERIHETLEANDLADAAVRLTLSRGVQSGRLTPEPATDPTVLVTATPLNRGGVDGSPRWTHPATLEIVSTRRIPDASIPAAAKTLNYLNGILARLALENGDEALMLDGEGWVTEGATSNVFFVRDGTLHTPGLGGPVLPGVTRRVVLSLADRIDLSAETGRYRLADLERADEVFLTNSTWEVRPVSRLEDRRFESWPITEELRSAFDDHVEETCYAP